MPLKKKLRSSRKNINKGKKKCKTKKNMNKGKKKSIKRKSLRKNKYKKNKFMKQNGGVGFSPNVSTKRIGGLSEIIATSDCPNKSPGSPDFAKALYGHK
jgi:hypothetical protein